MMLMSRVIENYDRKKAGGTKNWGSPITGNFKGQRGINPFLSSPSKFIQAQLGKMCGNATISAGRKSRSYTAGFRNLHSLNFGSVDGSRVMPTGTGSGPRIDLPAHCVNAKSPTSINFLDVSPTDRELRNGVSDDQPVFEEGYFRFKQKNVDQIRNKNRDQNGAPPVNQTTLQDARPEKKTIQCATDTTEPVIHIGPKSLWAIHPPILSQLVINSVKVVH